MTPTFINMAGAIVANKQVLEYAHGGKANRGAHWWVLCLACHGQQEERGSNLRRAQKRADFRIVCRGCGQ